MASKTRDKLIEAAKQVFILKGLERTTISDIAQASDKGRRTIYTYFKNKREIFRAVIERESDNMVLALRQIVESDMNASDKLAAYINAHVGRCRNLTSQSTTLRSLFSMDLFRSERMRRIVGEKEESMLVEILEAGARSGEFDAEQASRLERSLYAMIRGIEQMHAVDGPLRDNGFMESWVDFVVDAVRARR